MRECARNAGLFRIARPAEKKFADCLAVGAVQREPFSTANSLLTGKIAGNLAFSGSSLRQWEPEYASFCELWLWSHSYVNREFSSHEQGIIDEEQGKAHR